MVLTPSTMLPLGTRAPSFRLKNVDGSWVSLSDFEECRALLVMFICNHCPYVKHLRKGLAEFGRDYQDRPLGIVAISSNDPGTHPQDGPEEMAREAEEAGYTFPYLFDESQEVARAFRAACTPDFFLFDETMGLVYRGQFDSSRPGNDVAVTGSDLRRAVDAVLAGIPVDREQMPSIGCNIKWKPGHEPDYFSG